jgi:acetyl esterase/lipase
LVLPIGFRRETEDGDSESAITFADTESDRAVSINCLSKSDYVMMSVADWARSVVSSASDAGAGEANFDALTLTDGRQILLRQFQKDGLELVSTYGEAGDYFVSAVYASSVKRGDVRREAESLLMGMRAPASDGGAGVSQWWHPTLTLDSRSLATARTGFVTRVSTDRLDGFEGKPAVVPPRGVLERRSFQGPVGRLTAYVSPDAGDGTRRPCVVWAHGGFGGLGEWLWQPAPRSNDQSVRAFREAGIVVVAPSFRGEDDNGGRHERYLGEADDYLAAARYAATLRYVDPNRIYLAGHSSGGTLVLLGSELSTAFRAAFSIGGDTDLVNIRDVPFDRHDEKELAVRRAAPFVRAIRVPTFYFEGSRGATFGSAQWMAARARESNTPFYAYPVRQASHFTILAPLTELLARKILADTGATTNVQFTQTELDALAVEK